MRDLHPLVLGHEIPDISEPTEAKDAGLDLDRVVADERSPKLEL